MDKNATAGQIKFPHIIDSAGEKITFFGIAVKDGIEVLEGELEVQPGGGPPMHTHYRQEEGFEVISGTMAYQIAGEEIKYASPGDTLVVAAGIPHKFWNPGTEVLKCRSWVTPPENFVYFLTELYKSINANKGKPGAYDGAFLLDRYRSEFAINEIPVFVQKFIFPVVLFFGRLTGKNRKFSSAPAPVG